MRLKKVLKNVGKTLLVFIGLIGLYLLTAFFLSRITIKKEANTKEEIAIHILTNGVHTDLVVPVRSQQIDWSRLIPYPKAASTDSTYRYLAMGWGDKGFYLETPTWAELKASVAFKAAFGLSTTAMHTTYYAAMTESESCKKIMISKDQYARLIEYLSNGFQKNGADNFMHIETDANYGNTDAFYEGTGKYSLFYTCNTWANSGLKYSGQKACLWTAFDTGIFSKY